MSDFFSSTALLGILKPIDYLYKEKVLVFAKAQNYKEAFNICIDKL